MQFGSYTLLLYSVENVKDKKTADVFGKENKLWVFVLQSIFDASFFFIHISISCCPTHFGRTTASHFHNCNLSEKSLFSVGCRALQCRERKGKQNNLGLSVITMCDELRLPTSTCQSRFLAQKHWGPHNHTHMQQSFHVTFGGYGIANTACYSPSQLWITFESWTANMCAWFCVYAVHQSWTVWSLCCIYYYILLC